jgi:hypothetical protein
MEQAIIIFFGIIFFALSRLYWQIELPIFYFILGMMVAVAAMMFEKK